MSCWQRLRNGYRKTKVENRKQFDISTVSFGLNEKNKYSTRPKEEKPRPKSRALMPRRYEGRLELSTFCIEGMADQDAWMFLDKMLVGDDTVEPFPPIPARVDIEVQLIHECELDIDANWQPERHVDVIGWPFEEEAQKSITQVMSAKTLATTRPEWSG